MRWRGHAGDSLGDLGAGLGVALAALGGATRLLLSLGGGLLLQLEGARGQLLGLELLGEHDLVILDAADMSKPPVASIHIPHRIPPGFHGNWLADEA